MKTMRAVAMLLAVGMFLGVVGVSAAPAGVVYTIDDEDPGYTPSGAWTQESGGTNGIFYYSGDEWYQSAPNNGATTSWSFTGLPSGKYYLAASYFLAGNRTSNAHYAISDGIPAADIDQRPNVYDLGGRGNQGLYRRLSTQAVSITDGTLDVAVSNTGTGYLMADSVRLETARPDAVQVFVVDNRYPFEGRPGYSTTGGGWGHENAGHTDGEAYNNTAGATATFDFTALPDGYYRVSSTWVATGNRSLDAVYTMTDGAGVAHVNQQVVPADETFDNVGWKMLDPLVRVTDGTFTAVLSNNDVGRYIMADAVRVEQVVPTMAVQNPSFEADVLGDGAWTGVPTDWSDNWPTNNNSGAYNPTTGPAVPDGANVGFLNLGGWMAQYLEDLDGNAMPLAPGDGVSVTLMAASRGGLAGGLLDVDIRTPGNVSLVGGLQRQVVGQNDFIALTYNFIIGASEATPLLVIQNSTASDQLWVDSVRVSQGDIPEPATCALSALALAALGGYVRRRRKA